MTKYILLALIFMATGPVSMTASQAGGLEKLMAGDRALNAGLYKKARKLLTAAINKGDLGEKKLAQAFLRRGTASYMLSRHTAAISDFTAGISLKVLGGREKAYAFYYRGKAFEGAGLKVQAKGDLSTARRFGFAGGKTGATPAVGKAGSRTGIVTGSAKKASGGGLLSGWFGNSKSARTGTAGEPSKSVKGSKSWNAQTIFND